MFRKMRKSDRELTRLEALSILERCPWGVLSTVGADGWPYGVPVNYAVMDGAIYIHCAKEGHKLDNIRYCDKVCFTAVTRADILSAEFSTDFESAVAYGRASETDADEKTLALLAIIAKYSPEHRSAGEAYVRRAAEEAHMLRIDVEHITGKARK